MKKATKDEPDFSLKPHRPDIVAVYLIVHGELDLIQTLFIFRKFNLGMGIHQGARDAWERAASPIQKQLGQRWLRELEKSTPADYEIGQARTDLSKAHKAIEAEATRRGDRELGLLAAALMTVLILSNRNDHVGLKKICALTGSIMKGDSHYANTWLTRMFMLSHLMVKGTHNDSPAKRSRRIIDAYAIAFTAGLQAHVNDLSWIPKGDRAEIVERVASAIEAHFDFHEEPKDQDEWRDLLVKMLTAAGVPKKKARNIMWANQENGSLYKERKPKKTISG